MRRSNGIEGVKGGEMLGALRGCLGECGLLASKIFETAKTRNARIIESLHLK